MRKVVAECRELGGGTAKVGCRAYDFTEDDAAEGMVLEALRESSAGVDILVNSAAMRNRKAFGAYSGAEFDRMMAVNLRSALPG